jgi:NAD(P)-dependent dehydrogenase (short-subunit alcohol dehydrogenase family)
MSRADAPRLLREGLLAGVAILVANANANAGAGEGSYGAAVEGLCGELGASVTSCMLSDAGSDEEVQATVERALEGALAQGELDMLVIDAAGLFAAIAARPAPADDERAMLIGSLQASWNITSAVVNTAFLARTPEGAGERGWRIVYIAPPPAAGTHAEAARAGLENLARTLSIEWARHGITPVTVAPGKDTPAGEVAALSAYLASPAGAYFSGCLLDLRGPARS